MEDFFLSPYLILVIAAILGLFMAWGIGANDVANAMGTSVGSKALTLKQAIIIAAIFEFLGAYLAGGEVTSTIRKGIVDPQLYVNDLNIFIIGMMSSLLAAGFWLYIASNNGWPVSTTHSIVGAIVGFVLITKGIDAVSWFTVGEIASSWITSPLIAGILAFLIYLSAKKLILNAKNQVTAAIFYIPFYSFLVAGVIAQVVARKGLSHIGLSWNDNEIWFFTALIALLVGGVTSLALRFNKESISSQGGIEYAFGILMIVTACAMAFAHGSNDVANAIGPVAAIISVVNSNDLSSTAPINPAILLLGGAGIVLGLTTLGYKVIKTVGEKITKLTPSLGFSAEMAAASTVVFASYLGFPISTTHTLIGGVIGVGLANSAKDLDWSSVYRIFASWIITIPIGAVFTILFYVFLRVIFNV